MAMVFCGTRIGTSGQLPEWGYRQTDNYRLYRHDGRNAPPIKFPENKTQTTFRSQNPQREGFNELRF